MNFFTRLIVRKNENLKDPKTREACGKRVGLICIILNTIMAGAKIALGLLSGAVSILADGFNNLTDCGSNVVSVIGFKMSGKPADKEHPFGHQRAEAVSALLISALIIVVAFELATESLNKILSPELSTFSIWLVVILGGAVALKVVMYLLNRAIGKATDSATLLATAADSLSDAIATTAVLIAMIITHFTGVLLDGPMGIAVSVFIAISGIKLLKETISSLLGEAPDKEVVSEIQKRVFAFSGVHGIHDLAVHSYGQTKMYATVHVEVDAAMPIMEAHDLADLIEKDFIDNTNIILTVHIDPLVLNDPIINALRERTVEIINGLDSTFKIHDFRVAGGVTHTNIVFDVAVPFDAKLSDLEIENLIKELAKDGRDDIGVVVTVERQNIV